MALTKSGLLEGYRPFPVPLFQLSAVFQLSQPKLILRPKQREKRQKDVFVFQLK